MNIRVLKESGHEESMLGLSLSFGSDPSKLKLTAMSLARKDGGHNKFLESIIVWLDVTAPRFWWSQADTYRLSSKNSESTMHTVTKRKLTQKDFQYPIPVTILDTLNMYIEAKDLRMIKNMLPEGFLQRRVWCVSYKTLKNIISQRMDHKLPEWKLFCDCILNQVEFPGYLQ